MRRRSRRAERFFAVLSIACVAWLGAAPAQADLSGATDGRALFGVDGRLGGGLMVDLWGTRGTVRPGASFGLGALSEHDDASSRFVTPLAFSLTWVPRPDGSSFYGVARIGGYLGAEKGGFIGGMFAGGALGYGIGLGEGATFRVGLDVWGLVGKRGGVFLGPAIGLGF